LSGTPAIKPDFLSSLPVNLVSIPVSIEGATALTPTPEAEALALPTSLTFYGVLAGHVD
jgi:hypothetical protein